jgi:hypothetical protein
VGAKKKDKKAQNCKNTQEKALKVAKNGPKTKFEQFLRLQGPNNGHTAKNINVQICFFTS